VFIGRSYKIFIEYKGGTALTAATFSFNTTQTGVVTEFFLTSTAIFIKTTFMAASTATGIACTVSGTSLTTSTVTVAQSGG